MRGYNDRLLNTSEEMASREEELRPCSFMIPPPSFEAAIASDGALPREPQVVPSSIPQADHDYVALTVKDTDDDQMQRAFRPSMELGKPTPLVPKDGVFTNLSAKPEAASELPGAYPSENPALSPNALPPSYNEAVCTESVPSYFEAVVVNRVALGSDDEILFDGMSVGGIVSFIANCFVSYVFDLIGFLFCFVFSITHASRNGAICGLGLSLIRHGTLILARLYQFTGILAGSPEDDIDYEDDGQYYRSNFVLHQIIAYACVAIGFFLVFSSSMRYYKARSLLRIANTTSSA